MPVERRRPVRTCAIRFKPYYGQCPAEPTAFQSRYFHESTGEHAPIFNPGHDIDRWTCPPMRIRALHFVDCKWQNAQRPPNYFGPWPPTAATQLMSLWSPFDTASDSEAKQRTKAYGKPTVHDCLGKYLWQDVEFLDGLLCQEEVCDHTLSEWLTGAEAWEDRFELRSTPNMGYGLHSKQAWRKDDILGAYLGELIPTRNSNPDYCHEVFIGPEFSKTKPTIAYIDAENCGNYTRFCNHSCEYNAVIAERRVGKERVLALTAVRSIAAGEQITIDYGSDYFRCRPCLCGSARCRYPDLLNERTASGSRHEMKKAGSVDTDRAARYDSVLDSDNKVDQL